MTPEQAQQITEALIARYNLHGWQVWTEDDWRGADSHELYGSCHYSRKLIVLSTTYLASDEKALDTIMHEIAHALARPLCQPDEPMHGWTFHRCLRYVQRDCKRFPPATGSTAEQTPTRQR